MHLWGPLTVALLDPHRSPPLRPRSCPKILALAGERTPANCLLTVMCQWRQAAVLREVVRVSARAEAPVAAQGREEVAVVASQPAPSVAIK